MRRIKYQHAFITILCSLGLIIPEVYASTQGGRPQAGLPHYIITIDEKLNLWQVKACWGNLSAQPLRWQNRHSPKSLVGSIQIQPAPSQPQSVHQLSSKELASRYTWKKNTPPEIQPGFCHQYQMDASKLPQRDRIQTRETLITSYLFWRLEPTQEHLPEGTWVEFRLPAHLTISTPWPLIKGKQFSDQQKIQSWYGYIGSGVDYLPGKIAIGQFPVEKLKAGKSDIRLALIDMDSKKQAKKVKKWIQKAGIEAILSLDNFFPQQSTQVLAVHSGRQREVVPWAEVQRGGQPAVHLYIDANHSLTDFYADWTLTHEMSHLYLPFIDYNHRWFSEGVASYYQNILRGRNGLLTPEQAWERLIAGFHRGKKASGIRSLAQTNAIMQMYWGGAALIFLADVQLRQLNPPQSMDQALNLLSQCCLQPNQYWSIQRIIQTLDQLSQSKIFSTLYFQWADSRKFPEVEETLNQLGIRRLGRSVVIDPKAPLATIATDMMRSRYQTQ